MAQKNDTCVVFLLSHAWVVPFRIVSRLLTDIQSEATSTMQKVLNEANADLARRRQDVAQRNQASRKDVSEKKNFFTSLAAEVDSMEKSLFAFRSTLAS